MSALDRVSVHHHQISWGWGAEPCGMGNSNAFLLRDAELTAVRGQRNRLCDLLGVPRPQPVPKVTLFSIPWTDSSCIVWSVFITALTFSRPAGSAASPASQPGRLYILMLWC